MVVAAIQEVKPSEVILLGAGGMLGHALQREYPGACSWAIPTWTSPMKKRSMTSSATSTPSSSSMPPPTPTLTAARTTVTSQLP